MFDATGGGGAVMRATGRGGRGAIKGKGSGDQGETDEVGELVSLDSDEVAVDPLVRARARQIAARLSVRRPRRDATAKRGAGTLVSTPYRGSSDEIDLDATIEVLAERPVPDDEDIIVRERMRTQRSVVLLVDVSGSAKGEQVRTAAATVGALAGELQHDALGVVAFWSDAAIVHELGRPTSPMSILDTLLKLPARGLTNVAFPLEIAAKQLARVPARDARVVLLSDCVHNAGPDPRPLAARLPRLDVLLDASGENDLELGRQLAAKGRGICRVIHDFRDVAPAISALFTPQ